MLRITVCADGKRVRIEAAGKIGGPWVAELENAWRSVCAPGKEIEIDLKEVTGVDEAGVELLKKMHRAGARLVTCGVMMTALVDEIAGRRHPANKANRIARIVGALVILHGLSLHAQSASPATLRLTLRDAVRMALRQNPQVAIANLNLAENQESRNIARAALLPNASLNASEIVARGNLATTLGTTIPGFPAHYGPFWATQAGPGFSAPVFDLTLWEKWRASKETVRRVRKALCPQRTAAPRIAQRLVGARGIDAHHDGSGLSVRRGS